MQNDKIKTVKRYRTLSISFKGSQGNRVISKEKKVDTLHIVHAKTYDSSSKELDDQDG